MYQIIPIILSRAQLSLLHPQRYAVLRKFYLEISQYGFLNEKLHLQDGFRFYSSHDERYRSRPSVIR